MQSSASPGWSPLEAPYQRDEVVDSARSTRYAARSSSRPGWTSLSLASGGERLVHRERRRSRPQLGPAGARARSASPRGSSSVGHAQRELHGAAHALEPGRELLAAPGDRAAAAPRPATSVPNRTGSRSRSSISSSSSASWRQSTSGVISRSDAGAQSALEPAAADGAQRRPRAGVASSVIASSSITAIPVPPTFVCRSSQGYPTSAGGKTTHDLVPKRVAPLRPRTRAGLVAAGRTRRPSRAAR